MKKTSRSIALGTALFFVLTISLAPVTNVQAQFSSTRDLHTQLKNLREQIQNRVAASLPNLKLDPTPVPENLTQLKNLREQIQNRVAASLPNLKPDPTPVTESLIANGTFEESTADNMPLHWNKGMWGTHNALFSYPVTGVEGSKAARVEISQYTSGDAKWYSDPVAVTAGGTYAFADQYTADTNTVVVVAAYDAQGTASYFQIGTAPATHGTWETFSATFDVPAQTATVSVFHLLNTTGSLTIDNVSLTEVTSPTLPANDLPVNHSVEVADGDNPYKWIHSDWGVNSPIYQYVSGDAHDGTRSVKVTMTNYESGDAKWMFQPVALDTDKDYRFTAWYKTNVTPHVVVQYQHDDGSYSYHGMHNPQPGADAATAWQKYSDTFTVPAGVVTVSVFFFLTTNGWVQTDDYSIEPYTPVPFARPLVTLTFDDGFEENVDTALPVLANHGFLATYCFATQFLEGQPDNIAKARRIAQAGHEICSHTVTHPFLTRLSDSDLTYELSHSKDVLESIMGQTVTSFASPYGDYNEHVNQAIVRYYTLHRTVDEGYNTKDNLNPYMLRVQNITPSTTIEQYRNWVDKAVQDKVWLIFVYHVVAEANPGPFDVLALEFASQMDYLAQSAVTVLPLRDALQEVAAQ